jgi:DNA-binding MarR family transcriptional regulator
MGRPAIEPDRLPELLLHAMTDLIGRDEADLTARQLAVFLVCTLEEGPHTVRGLADRLQVLRSTVTRALDRLALFSLVRRAPDPRDRRSIVVERTDAGLELTAGLGHVLKAASRQRSPGKPIAIG